MYARIPALILPIFFLGFLVSHEAQAGCSKDTECKGDRICVDGECVSPPDGSSTSTKSSPQPDRGRELKMLKLAEAKEKLRGNTAGMVAGYSLAGVFLIGGVALQSSIGGNVYSTIFYVAGVAELIVGIVATANRGNRKSEVQKLENELFGFTPAERPWASVGVLDLGPRGIQPPSTTPPFVLSYGWSF